MSSISPKLPLSVDSIDGAYRNIKTYKELVAQHVKMLVLTSPGERPMNPDYGVGIKRFLFEQNLEMIRGEIKSKIFSQFNKYLPYLELDSVTFKTPEDQPNALLIRLGYTIVPLNVNIDQGIPIREVNI